MARKKRREFSREFKTEAVKLITDKGYTVAEAARSLGIDHSGLLRWKKQFEQDPQFAFPGKGHLKAHDEELRRLKAQLNKVTEEREILKKALAYFAQHQR